MFPTSIKNKCHLPVEQRFHDIVELCSKYMPEELSSLVEEYYLDQITFTACVITFACENNYKRLSRLLNNKDMCDRTLQRYRPTDNGLIVKPMTVYEVAVKCLSFFGHLDNARKLEVKYNCKDCLLSSKPQDDFDELWSDLHDELYLDYSTNLSIRETCNSRVIKDTSLLALSLNKVIKVNPETLKNYREIIHEIFDKSFGYNLPWITYLLLPYFDIGEIHGVIETGYSFDNEGYSGSLLHYYSNAEMNICERHLQVTFIPDICNACDELTKFCNSEVPYGPRKGYRYCGNDVDTPNTLCDSCNDKTLSITRHDENDKFDEDKISILRSFIVIDGSLEGLIIRIDNEMSKRPDITPLGWLYPECKMVSIDPNELSDITKSVYQFTIGDGKHLKITPRC